MVVVLPHVVVPPHVVMLPHVVVLLPHVVLLHHVVVVPHGWRCRCTRVKRPRHGNLGVGGRRTEILNVSIAQLFPLFPL